MGNYLPSFYSTQGKVQVWYLNQDKIINFPQSLTLKQLKIQLNKINNLPKNLFYDWSPVSDQNQKVTLSQIIQQSSKICASQLTSSKMFIVINSNQHFQGLQKKQTKHQKILDKLKSVQKVDEKSIPQFQVSKSGRIVFQCRQSALFASAINIALQKSNATPQKLQALLQNNLKSQQFQMSMSTIGELFKKIGLIGGKIENYSEQELMNLAESLKSSKQFSDFDPKFVYFITEIYFKFMIQSKGKLQYIDYKNVQDFQIQYISPKSKIGIIGDYGTGLKDSIELLRNMVLKHEVDVIFHLGDVYYAGTPQQYEVSIVKPLNELRLQTKREIRFYSIPGNHDYYSWGLPFLCFVKGINEKEFQKQKASYFCIRDTENKWQFLGMDSAIFDSNPFNQIYPGGVGPFVQQKQLIWHNHRLQNFEGSTILMTHHQLFSIHERINGKLTKYRKFSCINPVLCAQMFKNMGNISGWFWGHEHSLMLFKDNLFGLSKCRLLGNSSFHVMFQKQSPYSRQKGFPKIPFIVDDKQYIEKYLPVNPNVPADDYFALSYAVMDLGKADNEGNVPIEYWCSPSYSNEVFDKINSLSQEDRKKIFFEEYKLYEQKILSIESLKKQRVLIDNGSKVYLRCQIGLALQGQNNNLGELSLNLSASEFQIQIFYRKSHFNHKILQFSLKLTQKQNYYLAVVNNQVKIIQINSKEDLLKNNAIWTCQNMCLQKDIKQKDKKQEIKSIFYGQPVRIHNQNTKKSLTWKIVNNDAFPTLEEPHHQLSQQELKIQRLDDQNMECLWMFQKINLIHE